MATANTALLSMGKMSMIGIWVETVLYGMSGVIFVLYHLLISRANWQVSSKSGWLRRTLQITVLTNP